MEGEYEPDIFRNAIFSARLENELIIQTAEVSFQFDETRKGYSIDVQAMDSGEFRLVVTLLWFHGNSEPSTLPAPILAGSHVGHRYLPCDAERSEIGDTRTLLIVANKQNSKEPDLIAPISRKQIQCTSMLEEGRWLQVLHVNESCRPPFCTGDREAARISTPNW